MSDQLFVSIIRRSGRRLSLIALGICRAILSLFRPIITFLGGSCRIFVSICQALGWTLGLMTLFGIVITSACFDDNHFGINPMIPKRYNYWDIWEAGALAWTFLFFIIIYIGNFSSTNKTWVDRVVLAGSFFAPFLIAVAAVAITGENELFPRYIHGPSVWLISLVLLIVDGLIGYHSTNPNSRRAYAEVAIFVDFPVVLALAVIVLYELQHSHKVYVEIFFSGAITFQFMLSNVIFVLVQAGTSRLLPPRVEPQRSPLTNQEGAS